MVSKRLAHRLSNDTSAYALCAADKHRLAELVSNVSETNIQSRAPTTRGKDNWGWQWWVRACADMDTPPIRPTDTLFEDREALLASHAVLFAARNMRPGRKGRARADPHSAWEAYTKARLLLAEWGCALPNLARVRRTLRGLLRCFIAEFGDDVLCPNRKQPFSRAHEKAMLALLEGRAIPGWSPQSHDMLIGATAFSRCTAARKGELCADNAHPFTRAHLAWFIAGVILAPIPENIKRANRLRITPTASKADPFNINWGGIHMWFDIVPGEHFSVALAMQRLELSSPCPPELRSSYPIVFDPEAPHSGTPKPVSAAWLARRFNILMEAALGPEVAAVRSWHSWRVTLACALRAAVDSNHPDGRDLTLVKVFGRWRSDSAVQLYGRLSPAAYAGHVSASLRADAANVTDPGAMEAAMASIDPLDVIAGVSAAAVDDGQSSLASSSEARPAAPAPAPRPPPLPIPAPKRQAKAAAAVRPRTATQKRPRRPGGSLVLVPARCFPDESCPENGGRGWDAVAAAPKEGTVLVTFTNARDASGRSFGGVRMLADALEPREAAPGPASRPPAEPA